MIPRHRHGAALGALSCRCRAYLVTASGGGAIDDSLPAVPAIPADDVGVAPHLRNEQSERPLALVAASIRLTSSTTAFKSMERESLDVLSAEPPSIPRTRGLCPAPACGQLSYTPVCAGFSAHSDDPLASLGIKVTGRIA